MKKIIPDSLQGFGVGVISVLALLMIGCGPVMQPVRGNMASGRQTFTGRIAFYPGERGDMEITANDGLWCSGSYKVDLPRTSPLKYEGTLICSDGRSGPLQIIQSGSLSRVGRAWLGNDMITFKFGQKMAGSSANNQGPPMGYYQSPPMGYQSPPMGYQSPPMGYQSPPMGYQRYQSPPMWY
jgi:hypothetical protein